MSTEDRILDAAARIFEEVGFRETTTRRIADEAGVNEVTLFRHFRTKERLLMAAVHRHASRAPFPTLPEDPQDPSAELTQWVQGHMARLHQLRHIIIAGLAEQAQYPEACARAVEGPAAVHADLCGWLTRLRERGLATGDWDTAMASRFMMGAMFAASMDAGPSSKDSFSPEIAAAHFVPLFLRAIGVTP